MIKIQLQKLLFHSFHGVHEEERILGGSYQVDVEVGFSEKEMINKLEQSVDYVALYEIVKDEMAMPTPMLETIVMKIGEKIRSVFEMVEIIIVSIIKLHPPIEKMEGDSVVIWEWKKNN